MAGQQMPGPEQPDRDKQEGQHSREEGAPRDAEGAASQDPGEVNLNDATLPPKQGGPPPGDEPMAEGQAEPLGDKAGGRRKSLSFEEALRVAQEIRASADQSEAPPVDYSLVTKYVYKLLDPEERLRVMMLVLKYSDWNNAALEIRQRLIDEKN